MILISEKMFIGDFLEDDINPDHILSLNDDSVKLTAYLVVDNSHYGLPSGGVRMAPDLTLKEVVRLARAMSLKCATYKIPSGGGKAGIKGDPNSKNKSLLLTSFAIMISPYLKENIYYPGTDMGITYRDLEKIFKVAKAKQWLNEDLNLSKNNHIITDHFTGYGVVFCLDTLYKENKLLKNAIKAPKIILEGFGKVGISVALCLKELGYKLVGLSTIKGAIYDDDGLDIDELLKLKSQYGDDLVYEYNSKNLIKVKKEKLFELSNEFMVDFIIPGARPDSINNKNIDKIDVKAIIPASNVPYADGIVDLLEERKIIAFPDFVSNAGASILLTMVNNNWNSEQLFLYMKKKIIEKTNELIKESREYKTPIYKLARTEAIKELKKNIIKKKRAIERQNKKLQ